MSRTPPQQPETAPVVSGTSILIFSVFLVGVTIGREAGGELSPYVLSCGLAGMLAFMGLDLAQTRRRERKLLKERRELVARLKRHLPTATTDESAKTSQAADASEADLRREVVRLAD